MASTSKTDWLATCHLYVVTAMRDSTPAAPVKIGITGNVRRRFGNLRTSSPIELGLLFAFDLPSSHEACLAEAEIHHILDRFRLRGEWFDLQPMLALNVCAPIVAIAAGQGLPPSEFLAMSRACGCDAANDLIDRYSEGLL